MARRTALGGVRRDEDDRRRPDLPRVLDELLPAAWRITDRYANNVVEGDHGRLKAILRAMRGLQRVRSAHTVAAGHAFVQNLRRGHYELTAHQPARERVCVAFDELAGCL